MANFLIGYLNNIRPLSDALKADLERYLDIVELPRHHMLLREGQRCDYIYVVISGLLRMYYIKESEEVCSRFVAEEQMCLSVNSFYTRVPGYEYIETLEASTIARIHHDNLEKVYAEHSEFNLTGRLITQLYFIRSEERLYLLRKQTAEDRYQTFVDNNPGLLQRVPLKYIASYLGLTLETISRIRKKKSMAGR